MRWLHKDWWLYLLERPKENRSLMFYLKRILCRYRDHPMGIIWYNIGGSEPDMRCKGCREDLG